MANKKKKKSSNVKNTNSQNVNVDAVEETTKEVSNQSNDNVSNATTKQKTQKKENQPKQKPKKVKEKTTPKLIKKVKETTSELKKVTWPTAGTVVKKTGVVLTFVIVFGLVLFGIDRLLAWLFELLTTSIA